MELPFSMTLPILVSSSRILAVHRLATALLAALEADARRVLRGAEGEFLAQGARVALITFHSLEDRPVKRLFAELIELGAADLTGGAATADEDEMTHNPRARSAKLRAVRIG